MLGGGTGCQKPPHVYIAVRKIAPLMLSGLSPDVNVGNGWRISVPSLKANVKRFHRRGDRLRGDLPDRCPRKLK